MLPFLQFVVLCRQLGAKGIRSLAEPEAPLPPLDSCLTARTNGDVFIKAVDDCIQTKGKVHFHGIVIQLLWKRILFVNVVQFLKALVSLSEPLVFAKFIRWIKHTTTLDEGIRLGLKVSFVIVLRCFLRTIYVIEARNTSRRITAGFSAAIYRAVERGGLVDSVLPRRSAKGEPSVIALVMDDLKQATQSIQMWHQIWSSPFQIVSGLTLIYRQAGLMPTVYTTLFVLISNLLQYFLTEFQRKIRKSALHALDDHSKCVSAGLDTMSFVKSSGLEPESAEQFCSMFDRAFRIGCHSDMLFALVQTVSSIIPLMAQAVLSMVILFGGHDLIVGSSFAAMQFLQAISTPLSQFPMTIATIRNGAVSAHRIAEALLIASQNEPAERAKSLPDGEIRMHFNVDTAADVANSLQPHTFSAPPGSRIAIMGSVGSGKSSLLLSLLNESEYAGHGGSVGGEHVGYMGQIPWYFSGTIRQNIMATNGPVPDDPPQRYRDAVEAAQLTVDIQTVIGDTVYHPACAPDISGGQRSRVALARALYSDAPVLLLDDAFVQLDARVASRAVASILNRRTAVPIARDRTIVIATQNPRQLALCDRIICLGPHGELAALGSPMQLITEAYDTLRSVLGEEGAHLFSRAVAGSNQESPIETQPGEPPADDPPRVESHSSVPKQAALQVSWRTFFSVVFPTRGYFYIILIAALFSHQYARVRQDIYTINADTVHQKRILILQAVFSIAIVLANLVSDSCAFIVSRNAYNHLYHRVLRKVLHAPLFYLTGVGKSAAHLLLTTECAEIDDSVRSLFSFTSKVVRTGFNFSIVLLASGWRFAAVVALLLNHVIRLAKAHKAAAGRLQSIRALAPRPYVSHFMQAMQGSAVIRAFGVQDDFYNRLCTVFDDIQQPTWMTTVLQQLLTVRAELLTAVLALGVAASAVFGSIGRPLREVWAECRGETLKETISQLGALQLTGVLTSSTALALSKLMKLGNQLVALLEKSSSLEVGRHMVARLVGEIDDMDQEASWRQEMTENAEVEDACGNGCVSAACSIDNSDNWVGDALEVSHVSLQYPSDDRPMLHDVNLRVEAGEHVAIVGRTGAGKTSLVTAVLRLTEPSSGSVSLGSHDLSRAGLHDLRRRIAIVPQGALLPPFPIRTSLSASGVSDDGIWNVLRKVGVADAVQEHGGLDTCLPQSLSAGQRQLVCVARALLRHPSLVILDEATACLDSDAEARVLAAVNSLKNVPIISICHSLTAASSCHRVAVMSNGSLVEQGRPSDLAACPDSYYSALVRAYSEGLSPEQTSVC